MKRSILTLSLLAALGVTSCSKDIEDLPSQGRGVDITPTEQTLQQGMLPTESAERGVLYIRIKRSAKQALRSFDSSTTSAQGPSLQALPSQMARTLAKLNTQSMEPVFTMDPRFSKRFRRSGLDLWYKVRFSPQQELRSAMQTVLSTPEIEYTEPVYAIELPQAKPVGVDVRDMRPTAEGDSKMPYNDPLLPDQWHYDNRGRFAKSIAGADIGLFEAWQTETGKPSVIVSVIDGGIDTEHEDLKDNLYINEKELNGQEGVDDDGNGKVDDIYGFNFIHNDGTIYPDDQAHGTHVAGTVGARTGNGIGVAGVAGGNGEAGSGVRLMSCQIFGADKEQGNFADAIRYAADNGSVVSQNSWGYPFKAGITALPSVYKEAIDYFIKYAGCDDDGNQLPNSPMKGGIVIFAAGNDGKDFRAFPACYEAVVAVASMAPDWKAAWYTNRGDWVDITAPGGDQYYPNGEVLSTLSEKITKDKKYGYMQGTSMACPHVSGVAALIVSHFGKQGFTAEECKQRLLGALKFENIDMRNQQYAGRMGRGYIDASLVFAENRGLKPDIVSAISVDKLDFTKADLSWLAVKDEDDKTPVVYRTYLSQMPLDKKNYQAYFADEIKARGIEPGSKVYYPITNLTPNTKYYIAVESIDRWGLNSELTFGTFTTLENHAPEIKLLSDQKLRVSALERATFAVSYADPDGHKVSVAVAGEGRGVSYQIKDGKIQFTLRAVAPVGSHAIQVIVTDELGAKSTLDIPFEVYIYKAPAFNAALPKAIVGASQEYFLKLASSITATPGAKLTYKASSSNGQIATTRIEDDGRLYIRGLKPGTARISVEVSDGVSEPAKANFDIRVVANPADVVYSVYPLPMTTELNIVVDPDLNEAEVELTTLTGVRVLKQTYATKGTGTITLKTRRLEPGTYMLRVRSSKGAYSRAIVKN